jgi:hypothetical protein
MVTMAAHASRSSGGVDGNRCSADSPPLVKKLLVSTVSSKMMVKSSEETVFKLTNLKHYTVELPDYRVSLPAFGVELVAGAPGLDTRLLASTAVVVIEEIVEVAPRLEKVVAEMPAPRRSPKGE